ncbi:helix-turn-helix domain-containing protein [Streptomyces fuscichromogenes]|uniref:XRE family transcriptional regulator n=1 Tax=Streptomyces fuscichromogenes TaxID=1324013 RepID=A0A917XQY6_9ACTN|nr:helix-turn-helix domain-containing protein [Streptomyces fuscichromogenes]GGN47321.1 XRE family transcriptional regulator [Streptomyces fuscichromogenes]
MKDIRTQPNLGVLLRDHRRRTGLTQRHLADLTTVSVRAIRNLEQGKVLSPRLETVQLLADGLRLGSAQRETLLDTARRRPGTGGPPCDAGYGPTPWPVLGPLTGRESEVAALADLLRQPSVRLVSVVGIGGVGKSHLAAEAMCRAAADGTRVLWQAPGEEIPAGELADGARRQRTVLVLDDVELAGGTDRLVELRRAHPWLRILLTACGPCGVSGEQILSLAPLPVPAPGTETDPELLAEVPSVRLLCTHIRAGNPLFRLDDSNAGVVAELCRRLDGLPRPLEFAGRWTLVRSLPELLAEAERSPFGLIAPPMTADSSGDFVVRLRSALGQLSPAGVSFLAAVARDHRSWSVAEAATAVGTSGADAAAIVFTLVTYGLVRSEIHAGDGPRFSVLNHVRHLYTEVRRDPWRRHAKAAVHRTGPEDRVPKVAVGGG